MSEFQSESESNSSESDTKSDATVDELVEDLLGTQPSDALTAYRVCQSEGLEPFCDDLETPLAILPDDAHRAWKLASERVRVWIHERFFSQTNRFLSPSDLSAVIRLLQGEAWRAPRRSLQENPVWQEIEASPVGQAIAIYGNIRGNFQGRTATFLNALLRTDIQSRIAPRSQHFPRITQVFSRRLSALIPLLRVIGLELVIEHREDGSHCTLTVQPHFDRDADGISVSPSGFAAAGHPSAARISASNDGTDPIATMPAEVEAALAEIRALQEEAL